MIKTNPNIIKLEKDQKVVFLTAFSGTLEVLNRTIGSVKNEMLAKDFWVIVLDNLNYDLNLLKIKDKKIIFLNYSGTKGAGNARNYGLDYILSSTLSNFLLWPIDGDDKLIKGSRIFVQKSFNTININMISFGMIKVNRKISTLVGYSGQVSLIDLLKRYRTPCGSTVIRIVDKSVLKTLRFGYRKRANDHLFFLSSAKHFKKLLLIKKPVLLYNVGNKNSLSSNKIKQPFYKFLALRDFGLSYKETIYYFILYLKLNLLDRFFYFVVKKLFPKIFNSQIQNMSE